VTGEDRQRQFVAIGCSRSAPNLSWPPDGLREQLLSPSRVCSAGLTNVKFTLKPVIDAAIS
jgi:hypothetical protein